MCGSTCIHMYLSSSTQCTLCICVLSPLGVLLYSGKCFLGAKCYVLAVSTGREHTNLYSVACAIVPRFLVHEFQAPMGAYLGDYSTYMHVHILVVSLHVHTLYQHAPSASLMSIVATLSN